ncbi:1,2-phenylacetyl-CoA epoxidase subunit PaaC [Actinoalloteichus hymeniacidonis]|uniref:Phenylacetate-CoA oxygenase, PaaI subunit n=1 Tax=Actinoalloteichus hymeniacidonis TaxID=340345 RepID=A0AAC9MX00_9PSEU|nr:1,2-phenylacetyl-CoA epoxidase subunit PaaC [Actinoalloteichus hymeniacidonis]AOS61352.1 phenylacetate-CoA oxygenase, PaaI subunit [Actinoalloteichus hymeniacidonis]MBB5910643.1 ring-1,2-phenylacetyl-CoA epoxidase subunit PaaC [Actinoalloteichus hymeniacidonis]
MSFDNAYEALAEEHDDQRWAFGTGFDDPHARVDRALPTEVDAADLARYCLMLGDDALILAQRLAEWCSRGPELEEDVAIANIALDLLGQARLLLTRAGEAEGAGRTEDTLAYLRDAAQFRNVGLVEIDCGPGPGGDFAVTMVRLLVFSSWRLACLRSLIDSSDPVLAAVAAKGVKELGYHRDHAAQWVVRLGDGTRESAERTARGIERLLPWLGELFTSHPVERSLASVGVAVEPERLRGEVVDALSQVLAAGDLDEWIAPVTAAIETGPIENRGRWGEHTPALTELLAEMQELARADPAAVW